MNNPHQERFFTHRGVMASTPWEGSPKAWSNRSWVRWTWAAAVFISAFLSPYYQKAQAQSLPEGTAAAVLLPPAGVLPSLNEFVSTVTGPQQKADLPTGLYVPGVLALPVIQQPEGQNNYVSTRSGELTQFNMASSYNTVGILAHNYLEGARFFDISSGSDIMVVYGDGHTQRYIVTQVLSYQALSPYSPYSDFVDLSAPDIKMTAGSVFQKVYGQNGRLVLQTCIAKGNNLSWGRLFIIALPASEPVEGRSIYSVKGLLAD